jgi:hypothetical protein
VKVAAYQAPLLPSGSREAVDLIRTRVAWCESHGVVILCCPEAILGGLADNAADPGEFAIDTRGDQLARALAPLASEGGCRRTREKCRHRSGMFTLAWHWVPDVATSCA